MTPNIKNKIVLNKKNSIKQNEIEKKFYKIKDRDELTLTGKQLKEFAEYNRDSVLKFPLDRLSAELMRRARNNLKDEIKSSLIGEEK